MKFFKSLKNDAKMTLISTLPGLDIDPLTVPKAASRYLPDWWRDMPIYAEPIRNDFAALTGQTVKKCPAFVHWFNQGIIIPAWADFWLKYNKQDDTYTWVAGKKYSGYEITHHSNGQFLDHANVSFFKENASFVFKLECPWRIVTPRGWSVYQVPLFYHFNKEWTILPGVIDTDVHHEINQQLLYFKDNEEVFIPKGTPLVQYIPFKRTKNTFDVRMMTKEDKYLLESRFLQLNSKLRKGYKEAIRLEEERIQLAKGNK